MVALGGNDRDLPDLAERISLDFIANLPDRMRNPNLVDAVIDRQTFGIKRPKLAAPALVHAEIVFPWRRLCTKCVTVENADFAGLAVFDPKLAPRTGTERD